MSEQAEELWKQAMHEYISGPYPGNTHIEVIAAALEAAERRGQVKMQLYCDELKADRAEAYREGVEAMRDEIRQTPHSALPPLLADLDRLAARALAKEDA